MEGPLVHHYVNRLGKVFKGREVQAEFGILELNQCEPSSAGMRIEDVEGVTIELFRQGGRITYASPKYQPG